MRNTNGTISVSNVNIKFRRDGYLNDVGVETQVKRRGDERSRLLGTDLWMIGTGDLIEEHQNAVFSLNDLSRATGLHNYAQAVTHRLMTNRGSHPEDEFFGVPWLNYLGRSYVNGAALKSNLIRDITEELYKDSRTREVVDVKVEFESPTVVLVECTVLPIGVNDEFVELGLSIRNNS